MSESPHHTPTCTPPKGEYTPPTPSDTRGPCPMLNTLANHGYIPRNGRNIQASEIATSLHDMVGVSSFITIPFTYPIFFTQQPPPSFSQPTSLWSTIRHYLRHPFALLHRFGMRHPNQHLPSSPPNNTKKTTPCLNLDQLATPHTIEHDISLTRLDRAQGDCTTPQPHLISALLSSSSDGGNTLSIADLASFRRLRIEQQREENPRAEYGKMQHSFACMEIALLLGVFGEGKGKDRRVRVEYVRAFLEDERLPVREGWVARGGKRWWGGSGRLGWVELVRTAARVRTAVGKVSFT
ncbi:Chloroperoxidase [Podospora aff. communis PSN243]|uniref:Chloroperoxidase n=1 Tax=Podospora aff. communis PSN243 TaxID=3040156 RepID=A0AAV9G4S0_9PEZI|nr:Chloroperoxidase [Podospora aff. communis PSN243]